MAGETKLEGIIDWINERQKEIKKLLNWPKGFPVSKTYIDALAKCDHHERAKAIAQVIVKARAGEQCDEEPSRLVAQKELSEASLIQTAGDGKILRGTLKHGREDQPPVHLLSFYECESGLVLDQFVANGLLGVSGLGAKLRQAINHVGDEMKAVQVVHHHHVEGSRGRAFFLVTARVQVLVVGAAIRQPVD